MAFDDRGILTVNGGSSSIKFAIFSQGDPPARRLVGQIERIGKPDARLMAKLTDGTTFDEPFASADHAAAAKRLIEWLDHRPIAAVGHRVVHGGMQLIDHQPITGDVLRQLKESLDLDLAHLPREIAIIEAFINAMPAAREFVCFDSEFHRDLPMVAKFLPIPRRFLDAGVRRLGFHGLSFAYLMQELRRIAGDAADGRVVLAHLGSGASMVAVRGGTPVDTTMAFTPTAGVMMATRPGDIDPGLLVYMGRKENLSFDAMDELVNRDCGLIGVSGGVSDMRDLLQRRESDPCAAQAIDLFIYTAKKALGALVAALGGLETLVFSGGIGEHVPEVRWGICAGLGCFGIELDDNRNRQSAAIISADVSRVTVRVIPTDEEVMIAKIVQGLMK